MEQLTDGDQFTAPHIIVATEATGLVQELASIKPRYQSTTHIHFVAEEPPIKKPLIALNTDAKRLVNNICTINKVAPGYAPAGQFLVSISIVGDTGLAERELEKAVRSELQKWFGKVTRDWAHLHTRVVKYALPNQSSVQHEIAEESLQLREGLYACGDFQLNGSINAAMKIGREVGEWVSRKV